MNISLEDMYPEESYPKDLPEDQLRTMVFESCKNALENGYDVDKWSAAELADDIADYDPDLEGVNPLKMRPHCQAWLDSLK